MATWTIGLPFTLDLWHDTTSHACVSIQVQMLSGNDFCKKVFVHILSDQNELVLTSLMNMHMAHADQAFPTFVLDEMDLNDHDKNAMLVVLKHHSETAAHMVVVSKIKGQSDTNGLLCKQQTPLPHAHKHQFASKTDGMSSSVETSSSSISTAWSSHMSSCCVRQKMVSALPKCATSW